jgi:hypothetical protein
MRRPGRWWSERIDAQMWFCLQFDMVLLAKSKLLASAVEYGISVAVLNWTHSYGSAKESVSHVRSYQLSDSRPLTGTRGIINLENFPFPLRSFGEDLDRNL